MKQTIQSKIIGRGILGALLIPSALAENDGGGLCIDELETSTVTATEELLNPFEVPYSVTHLDSDIFQKKQVRNLVESLTEVVGVTVQKTANGHGSPFIRGFTGYRTLVLIDGVRYNNSVYRDGPNEYFSLIDARSIDRLELLQGPASTLYGSDAIGGTLNLYTKSSNYNEYEEDFIEGELSYRYSSAESSHQERASIQFGEGGKWGVYLGLSAKQFGDVDAAEIGKQKNTGYDEYSYDFRFDVQFSHQWELSLAHQMLEQDDVWRTHSTIFGESFEETTVGSDLRRLKDQNRTLTYIKLKGEELSYLWADKGVLTLSYQTWDEEGERERGSGVREDEFFDSAMLGVDMQLTKYMKNVDLVYGFDVYQDRVYSGRVDFNSDGTESEVRVQGPVGDDATFLQTGVYGQVRWDVSDRVELFAGTRLTHVNADVGSFEDPVSGQAASFEDDWTTVVNSVRLKYALNENYRSHIWSGVSQSFRAPNIADLSRFGASRSDEFEVAATGLEPEQFVTFELGLKADTTEYQLSVSYYYTLIDDFITSNPTGNVIDGLTEVSKENSAEGFVQGIELAGRYFLNDEWSVWGNVTWIEGELDVFSVVGFNDSVREPISRIVPATVNAGAEWKRADGKYWAGLDIQIAAKADKLSSGDEADTQRIPSGGTPSYKRVNIYGGCEINSVWIANIVVNNVFDEAYRVHGSGVNEPGFGVNVGMKATF